jgi:Putative 2OG-Fe(II) oxygenase
MVDMNRMDLFSIPVYRIKFEDHKKYKDQWIEYLSQPEVCKDTTRRKTLKFTHPNLHKEEMFLPFTNFASECLYAVMGDLGFEPQIQMTGLWGTIQEEGGYHHRHTHGNSFLAGVYYLEGNQNNSGTTFFNPSKEHRQIIPRRLVGRTTRINNQIDTKFEEGILYIFPAWLEHQTNTNRMAITGSVRKILSFNSMPVGKTNNDPFDRYNFPNTAGLDMINGYSEMWDHK